MCLLNAALLAQNDGKAMFREAQKAERAGQMARAYLLYSQAAAVEPRNTTYWLRAEAVRTRALLEAKPGSPRLEPAPTRRPAGDSAPVKLDQIGEGDLADARRPQPPRELKATSERKDIALKADARELFERVAKSYGLDCVFDGDYPTAGPKIAFEMDQADYRDALHGAEAATGSFIVPLSEKVFLVVKDTVQKRQEKEPSATVLVAIPQTVTVQEAQELAVAVRQTLEIRKFGIDTQRRMIVLRDSVSKIRLAQPLIEQLLAYRPEVAVDLEFIEMSQTDARKIGIDLTTQFPVVNFVKILKSMPSIPQGVTRLALFGGGRTVFGVGLVDATVVAQMSKSNALSLMRSTIRSSDGQAATFHVGDKYPIVTSGFFGGPIATNAQVYTPTPSFNFEELGLKLKVTPKVQGPDEVSLEVEAEFKVLGGTALNGIPIIAERKLNSRVRLREGEWGIVAGVMSANEARAVSGVAGLAQLPVLGALFRTVDRERDNRVVLIMMKPRLLSTPPSEVATHEWWTGTESRPLTPM